MIYNKRSKERAVACKRCVHCSVLLNLIHLHLCALCHNENYRMPLDVCLCALLHYHHYKFWSPLQIWPPLALMPLHDALSKKDLHKIKVTLSPSPTPLLAEDLFYVVSNYTENHWSALIYWIWFNLFHCGKMNSFLTKLQNSPSALVKDLSKC